MAHPEDTRAIRHAQPAGLLARKLLVSALIGEMLCFGHGAVAQTTVNVVGERPTNRIDRQVHDVKSDTSSSNGSASDALNNVPAVAVDPDGTVSLRGNTNVQILVDGKPSAMMQGDNRGAALQAMPAEDIDSIEVINNPGAQFGNEGGGGPILNLVMKRSRKPGGFGVANANYGTGGRFNTATSGSYNSGRFGFQGGVNFRRDGRDSVGELERERIDPATGIATRSTQASTSTGLNDSAGLNGGISYNLGDKDTLSAQAAYMKRSNDQNGIDRYQAFTPGGSTTASDYMRTSRRSGDSGNYSLAGTWDHKGDVRGETLKLDLRLSSANIDSDSDFANTYAVRPQGARDTRSNQVGGNDTRIADFTGDYERPLEAGGLLKAGFKVVDTRTGIDTLYTDFAPVTGTPVVNPRRTNGFDLDQGNLALYASYQMRLNEYWGVQAGLRTEYTHLNINQLTSQIEATNRYFNHIPSAFATYKVSDDTNLRFSYAHRLRRANAGELNPFVVYRDELNESSGNPKLKPAQTDSFEVGLETRFGNLESNLRGYYREDTDTIQYRSTFVGDNVLLTRPENLGGSRSSGMEFTVSGRLTPAFTVNASGNLARSEQRQFDTGGADVTRTASSLSGRVRLNYQLSPANQVQLMLHGQGKTLTGQGYREPTRTANLSVRHSLSPALSVVMNMTDIFNSQKMETITDTATLKETNVRRFDGRIVYVGLSYRFGGVSGGAMQDGRGEMRFGPGHGGAPGGFSSGFGGPPGR
ncbi:TonB-dependent receptor [Massilia horti]|uniref:TonB-dependent receptor n=1 Tax=Massilia horti TaxID=2562153 RepID=A0A4Y9T442_9BURK|nr:TonB-dependent receptor [Massilia horti]